MNKKAMYTKIAIVAILVIVIITFLYFRFFDSKPTEISYSQGDVNSTDSGLIQKLEAGKIGALYIESYKAYALKSDATENELKAF